MSKSLSSKTDMKGVPKPVFTRQMSILSEERTWMISVVRGVDASFSLTASHRSSSYLPYKNPALIRYLFLLTPCVGFKGNKFWFHQGSFWDWDIACLYLLCWFWMIHSYLHQCLRSLHMRCNRCLWYYHRSLNLIQKSLNTI